MSRVIIENVKDADLTHIFECGQVFRWRPYGEGYRGAAGDKSASVSYDSGVFTIDATGGDEDFWRHYFDLDTDYGEIKSALVSSEPRIKAATDYGYGIRILNQDLYETIISFIISQNNNIPRIRKNIEALCDSYGERINDDFAAFPSPEALASAKEDDLAKLRLGYRCRYIIESSKQYLNDGPPSTREGLLSFCGIGPKVADCIMLFGLHQVAAFPIDTWVKHIMNDMYGFDEKDVKGMQRFADERFGELAGYAQQYLFYYYRDRG
ncbi:MAG: 8-oxoguanine DNA glycosylase [Mogibacterium sp.]|nr:8-oxoguanine DNA glycosylase [Mogibacterium sp.]